MFRSLEAVGNGYLNHNLFPTILNFRRTHKTQLNLKFPTKRKKYWVELKLNAKTLINKCVAYINEHDDSNNATFCQFKYSFFHIILQMCIDAICIRYRLLRFFSRNSPSDFYRVDLLRYRIIFFTFFADFYQSTFLLHSYFNTTFAFILRVRRRAIARLHSHPYDV